MTEKSLTKSGDLVTVQQLERPLSVQVEVDKAIRVSVNGGSSNAILQRHILQEGNRLETFFFFTCLLDEGTT